MLLSASERTVRTGGPAWAAGCALASAPAQIGSQGGSTVPGSRRLRAMLALLVIVAFAIYGFLPTVRAPGASPAQAEAAGLTNLCADDFSPGYWKNYQNHFTDAQFYTLLKATTDFGAHFAAESQSAAISEAETILKLQGFYYVRSLLTAELNAANTA